MGRGLFWLFERFSEGLEWTGLDLDNGRPAGAEAHPLISFYFGPAEAVPLLQSFARLADDPKSSREKDSGEAAPEGGQPGGGGDAEPDSDPENEGFAQQSDEDGVPEDMATLVLDNTRVGSGLGQGAVLNPAEAPRVNYAADETSDAAVMLRVAAGDEAGFNFLVGKYHRAMISFLFRMVHNQAVAEELAQEVFLRVYRSRESYRAEAKFTTWLYRIATNLAVNHARDTKHERSAQNVYLDAPDEESGTTPDVADDTPTIEQTMLRDERMAAIRVHVMELPERQRMAVLMHKYQGMDYKQIGEVLKLSESATKSLLFRAYQTLREKLKDFV
jgi:RNA polymerase sigma-70 factor (ECF subfamily)